MKPLIMIDQSVKLKEVDSALKELEKYAEQKKQFLKKQIDANRKEVDVKEDELRKGLASVAAELNLVPNDFVETEKAHLHIINGVLFLCCGDHKKTKGTMELIESLMKN